MPPFQRYTSSAEFYDAIYTAIKDYGQEAQEVAELIQSQTNVPVRSLLDVATGTGLHLEHFARIYEYVEGLDLSLYQIHLATLRLPQTLLHQADMLDFNLGKTFDAVTCLFSAIGYMRTPAELEQAFVMMGRHLNQNGVLLVEPWIFPDVWQDGTPHLQVVENDDFKLVRMNRSSSDGNKAVLQMHYLVMRKDDAEPEHFVERHVLTMHTKEEYLSALRAAGFRAKFVANERRGYFVAVKQSEF